ncbi:conserved Plasmodium protein, unknown function [Plasmodium vivax]|uniref:Uncharacterized protein n=3 Tax=Plasmodium vivax TaxID=5855 RepID=A5K7S2_PLAVS|nr:hypothetical protein, conserved [Plasmodium vivax]KMZ99908.1 hypothetical protein PVNG_04548 [Plasmodium vivax North Korean]EDL44831.1 hypothetical protein, conserved [Plasmodium vivax]KMZ99957.1 hypothetical protein PVNG_06405 [Plasmodium vivax North Korean]CAG9479164.1 unnamed protein product [Plasmodium vivax]CAI7720149.1 conserved Plasmodium protein, unknown function [Plasmodium vivax]|eukprot:XP_001614558.1 hypothetical protein [Plasmodium vivax Sal-1]
MEGTSFARLLLYLAVFINCTAAYSFSQSKNARQNGNVFFTPMPTREGRESHLKEASQNAQEGYNPRKEKNAVKIKKNLNKLFKTLYPNEAQMEERERREGDCQGRGIDYMAGAEDMHGMHAKQGTQTKNRSYDGVGAATYSAFPRGSHDEEVRNGRRKGGLPSGNVLSRDLPSSYAVGQGGETGEYHGGGNVERSQKGEANQQNAANQQSPANQQSALHLWGESEKLKSESKFALMDYLKDFFQKSTYMKKFQNFIEIFFNKYDQRVLESTIFFNFDETLF